MAKTGALHFVSLRSKWVYWGKGMVLGMVGMGVGVSGCYSSRLVYIFQCICDYECTTVHKVLMGT